MGLHEDGFGFRVLGLGLRLQPESISSMSRISLHLQAQTLNPNKPKRWDRKLYILKLQN